MDALIDPLADTQPPRYAIESDDEDEVDDGAAHPTTHRTPKDTTTTEVKVLGDVPQGQPLIIATGRAGAQWGAGAQLGEQTGGVYVNKIQVGLLFAPTWAGNNASVLVSEALTRLPLASMHPYAQGVIDKLKPSGVALLDTYSVPTYATAANEASVLATPPVRFLSTGSSPDLTHLPASPFDPPNLLQSTSAALLLALSLPSLSPSTTTNTNTNTTLLLLPSAQLPTPPPKSLLPGTLPGTESSSPDHTDAWPAGTLRAATRQLLALASGGRADVPKDFEWKASGRGAVDGLAKGRGREKGTEIGEGGMYL